MRWLAEGTVAALAGALREVAPELAGYPIVIPDEIDPGPDPRWWASSAFIGEEFIAKFAWSRPAALRVRNEIGALTALPPVVPYLPEVVVGSRTCPRSWWAVSIRCCW
jgi:hypothetical protein